MPAGELRPIFERVYWSAVASLNNEPDELVDEAITHLSDATVACPELLARLADESITPAPRRVLRRGFGCFGVSDCLLTWPDTALTQDGG